MIPVAASCVVWLAVFVPLAISAPAPAAVKDALLQKQICDNFFVPDPLPDPAGHTFRTLTPAPGVKAEALTYATQLGQRVPAILYLPDPIPKTQNGKIPAFIVICGHGGDKYCWYSWYTGILFARGGVAVLTYDQIGEGERNINRKSGTRSHDNLPPEPRLARYLAGLMITDVRQGVSYLAQRPEIDPTRIAAGGYSLGSFVLALAGATEPRLHACVLCGGGNLDGPSGYWDRSGKQICQALPYQSLNFLGDRPAVIYALHADRGPTLLYNGLGDEVVAIPDQGEAFFEDLQRRTAGRHGSSNGVFDYAFAPSDAGHRPYFLTRPVVQWLARKIGFPNWSDNSIQAMPEIKIGDWANKLSVKIDKLYDTPHREGGTPALDVNVPGYARDMLDVFSPDQWEPQKYPTTLESWLRAVRADEANR